MTSVPSLLVLSLSLGACAATTGAVEHDRAPHTGVQLSLVPVEPIATQVVPAAIDPRLPRVDRMATQIRFDVGDQIRAELALCVSPQGSVTEVALAKGTGVAAVDAAIVEDVRAWQFAELPGTASLRTCQRATLAYRVR